MPKRPFPKAQSSKRLMKTLTDNPALPALSQTRTAGAEALIEHVGLHDAGDLIALTTPSRCATCSTSRCGSR